MTPSTFGALVRNVVLAIVAIGAAAVIAAAWPTPAHSQPAAPASAASAPERLVATPDTACGAPGIGRDPLTQAMVEYPQGLAGNRVGPDSVWRACEQPCGGDQKPRTWKVGPYSCTSDVGASDPRDPSRVQGAAYGQRTGVQQWTGPARGQLTLECRDSGLVEVAATCAPAVDCRAEIVLERGGVRYALDTRGVPLLIGRTALARSADGRSWPVMCADGTLVEVPQPPAVVTPPTRPPVAPVIGCGARPTVFTAVVGGRSRLYRYTGPGVQAGAIVTAQGIAAGDAAIQARCRTDGRFEPAPSGVTDPTNPWSKLQ